MQFSLPDSPFRNFFSYDSDNVFDFVLPIASQFVDAQHSENSSPLPPSAFVLKRSQGYYVNGYAFDSPGGFLSHLRTAAASAEAVVTIASVGSMSQDFSQGLTVICVQTRSYFRCKAFSLSTNEGYDILDDPPRVEMRIVDDADGKEVSHTCHLIGVADLLTSVF